MNINLEYYKVFYYVGKRKGITLAAEELSISQPAVSQLIHQLEKGLGTTLFIRTSKGVKFTPAGEKLFEYVKKGYESIQEGERQIWKELNLENGEITIGASDMTLSYYLLPYLEQFHEECPGIKIKVTNAPTPETIRLMEAGKIDFGVVSSPVISKKDLEIINVKEIEDVFIVGDKFRNLTERKLAYKELETLPVICLEQNTSTRKYIDSYLEQKKVQLYPEFELATSDMIVQFTRRNLGVGCVVKEFAKELLEKKELYTIDFRDQIPKRHFCFVMGKGQVLSTAAAQLASAMI